MASNLKAFFQTTALKQNFLYLYVFWYSFVALRCDTVDP